MSEVNTQQPLNELGMSMLSRRISSCFDEAKRHKDHITERLLKCYRQRKGEYESDTKTLIAQAGGQEIFVMLTDIKCRAADAWIKDVMQNSNESTWAMSPTREPELPPEISQEIQGIVEVEAASVAALGMQVEPEAMMLRQNEIMDFANARIQEEAANRCQKMENRIVDKMQEGKWKKAMSAAIYDFVTYPACILKGPVLRKRPKMKWGPNFTPTVVDEVVLDVDWVSPFDIFPGPSAVSIQDSYLIHRQSISRGALFSMKGLAGVNDEAISRILTTHPNGYKTTINGDLERYRLSDASTFSFSNPDGQYEALEYWGSATGESLIEWGMRDSNGRPIDPENEYQINAWKIANETFKVIINPDPLGRRPYSKASFVDVPGSFWGRALPELMADTQTMCNGAVRALAMNMGIASGPQVEAHVDRFLEGTKVTSMYPWKVWLTKSDRTGSGQPAIRFYQPDLRAAELIGVYDKFSKVADEVTGVPNYVYGSSQASGAGRTAAGLSMLMENAAKGIKQAILSLDAAHAEIVTRIYDHLMLHDPDTSIKGDMQVVAAGAIGAMIREQQLQARRDFMADTMNPVDAQIIGPQGRAHMLRERAKTIFPDVDKIVPDPTRMRLIAMAQQQAAAQQPGQGQPGQPGQPGQTSQGQQQPAAAQAPA